MEALIIIDMQKGSFTPETPRYAADQVVARINSLSKRFNALAWPVIFIQHDGSREGGFFPETEAWEILDSLDRKASDLLVSKQANDMFYKTDLREILDRKDIKTIYVTGCATDYCVEASVQSALVKDYQVVVVADGHTTADRTHISARQAIDHYNEIWADLSPTEGHVRVVPSAEILEKLGVDLVE
ncbi:cysteine hydrolase family protein [Persicobacter diffluens]